MEGTQAEILYVDQNGNPIPNPNIQQSEQTVTVLYVDQNGNPTSNPNINMVQIQQPPILYVDQNGNPISNPVNANINSNPNPNPNPNPGQVRCCCRIMARRSCVILTIFIIVLIALLIFGIRALFFQIQQFEHCFAANSTLWIRRNGDMSNAAINMKLSEVNIGDYALTMDPWTNDVFWDEVLLRIHYSWYDDSNSYNSMRTLYLNDNENNISSSITLTHNHFIYINHYTLNTPKIIQSQLVEIGDILFYYDYNKNQSRKQSVINIDEHVLRQKRAFFTMSPYVLVNNIVASPYIGPHPIYHDILHQLYVHLIFLRYFINHSVLAFLACCGYRLLLCTYWIFQMNVFAVFTVVFVLVSHSSVKYKIW